MNFYISSNSKDILNKTSEYKGYSYIKNKKIINDLINAIKTLYYKKNMILFCKKYISDNIEEPLKKVDKETYKKIMLIKDLDEKNIDNIIFKDVYIDIHSMVRLIICIDDIDIKIDLYFPLEKRCLKKFKQLSYKILDDNNTVIFPIIKEISTKISPINKNFLYVTTIENIYDIHKWICTLDNRIYIEFNTDILDSYYHFYIRISQFKKFMKQLKQVNSEIYDRINLEMLIKE